MKQYGDINNEERRFSVYNVLEMFKGMVQHCAELHFLAEFDATFLYVCKAGASFSLA